VFDLVKAVPLRELQQLVTDLDVRTYMLALLEALAFTHSKGIMHRDVKPANVLIDHSQRMLRLIDWGLADFYFPGGSVVVASAVGVLCRWMRRTCMHPQFTDAPGEVLPPSSHAHPCRQGVPGAGGDALLQGAGAAVGHP